MDKYFGWGPPNVSSTKREYLARSVFDLISEREDRFIDFKLSTDNKKFMAWWASRKLLGKDILHVWQQSGSCVGAGTGNLLNYSQCIEIALKGDAEEFKYIFFPYHYGIGRKRAGMVNKGEGSWGSAQAEAILNEGCIPEDLEGLPQYTKHEYDLAVSYDTEIDWSGRDRDRTWDYEKYKNVGIKHTIQKAAKVENSDDAFEAILNGYLISVCSDVGYNKLSSDGFNRPGPTWNHCMSIIGADRSYKVPYFIILNNWGFRSHGQLKDFETDEVYPYGLLRVRADDVNKMLRQGDSFTYSYLNGFEPRQLTMEDFKLV